MSKQFMFLLIWAIGMHIFCYATIFKKVVLTNPDALCLDGSPGVYYVYQGTLKNKWILSFQGGGWCGRSSGINQTLQDCYEFAQAISKSYPKDTEQLDQLGILSDNLPNHYKDWSKVILRYCTGTGHQGYRKDPILYKGFKIYFRGHNVTVAQMDSLHLLYNLFAASTTDIIVSGHSAGGLAVFLWTNYIRDRAAPSTKVISLPDSGIFLDSANIVTGRNQLKLFFQNFMKFSNEEINPPTAECNAAYPTQPWKCMFAEYIYPFIKVPLFVIQSPYDTWSLIFILGIECEKSGSLSGCNQKQLNYIEQYHTNTSNLLKAIAQKSMNNGYWAPSCCDHIYNVFNKFYNQDYRIPSGSANSVMKGVAEWEQGQSVNYTHMDEGNWPTNRPCSGLPYQQLMRIIFVFLALLITVIVIFVIRYIVKRYRSKNLS